MGVAVAAPESKAFCQWCHRLLTRRDHSEPLLYNWPQLVIRARFTTPSYGRRSSCLDTGCRNRAKSARSSKTPNRRPRPASHASAEDLLREAAALQEQTLGPDHPDLANTLNNLGVVCELADNPIDAEHYFRRRVHHRNCDAGV